MRPAREDENSDQDKEPDPPPIVADVCKALHTLKRVLKNQSAEQEIYEQYYSLAKNIKRLIVSSKQSTTNQFHIKSASNNV